MYSISFHSDISLFLIKVIFHYELAYIFSQYNLENTEKETKLTNSYSHQLDNHC